MLLPLLLSRAGLSPARIWPEYEEVEEVEEAGLWRGLLGLEGIAVVESLVAVVMDRDVSLVSLVAGGGEESLESRLFLVEVEVGLEVEGGEGGLVVVFSCSFDASARDA